MVRRISLATVALVLWAGVVGTAATLVTALAARRTAVGPVLVDLGHSHGVHLGDLAVAAIAYGGAAVAVVLAAGLWLLQLRERATRPLGA